MFFLASVCNNYAFDFNIPMPLHMIFRAVRRNLWKFSLKKFFRRGVDEAVYNRLTKENVSK